ncbi:hypothetical protein NP493_342g02054 [Ridgeia piscesae]|uniref:Uncharacterized protein n=1 Tax=Ridgeia piscesae TaxID=27915 RepID=A0AAD9L4G7_RIDPI|nr:hypothetical protein NP493_342g02054 [Ridgeia piscesae]
MLLPQAAAPKCTSATCKHGGLCLLKASGDSFRCNCTSGYWGEFCERVRCSPGEYYSPGGYNEDSCHPCPIGTYSPVQSVDEHCRPCPVDDTGTRSTTNQAGRTDVTQCIYMPVIKRLRPGCGPVSGGTRVLIDFEYLNGRRPVVTYLLEEQCTGVIVVDNTTIMCVTPSVHQASAGPITVSFGDETSALSTQNFVYHPDNETDTSNGSQCALVPNVTLLTPNYGPVSGGTQVLLDFDNLNGRQPVNVKLLGKYCAEPRVIDESTITCETPSVDHASAGPVMVSWNETAALSLQNFVYRPDPVIRSIDNIKTFISGGMKLRMHGEHLDSIYRPIMVVTRVYKDNIRVFTANHTKKTATELQFAIPKLTDGIRVVGSSPPSTSHESRRRRRALESNAFNSRDTHFYLGFRMDGVGEYRNMSTSPLPQYGELLVYNDPVYAEFEERDHVRKFFVGTDEFIHIRGKHLNYASHIRDVRVTVGTELCNITLLATNQLTCRPPPQKPRFESSNYAPGGIPGVTVYVGTLMFFIGYLNYVEPGGVSEVVIAVVVAIAVAFVVIVGVCLCVIRRRRRQAKDGTVRLRWLTQSHETNLYYVRGFFSDNPSGEYLTGQPAERGKSNPGLSRLSHRNPRGVEAYNGGPVSSCPRLGSICRDRLPFSPSAPRYRPQIVSTLPRRLKWSSLSLVTTPYRGRTMSSSVTPPSTPLTPSIYSGPYPNGTSVVLCNGTNTIFNIMDEIDEDTKASVEECLIDSSRLTLGEVIGQGYFGKVYRGELIDYEANIRRTVAVKTVHGK